MAINHTARYQARFGIKKTLRGYQLKAARVEIGRASCRERVCRYV